MPTKLRLHFKRVRSKKLPREVEIDYFIQLRANEWMRSGDEITFSLEGEIEDDDLEQIEAIRVTGLKIDRIRYAGET